MTNQISIADLYLLRSFVSPVNSEYCRQGSVVCFFVLCQFLCTTIIIEKKEELDKSYEGKINGTIIRSRCDWYEHGEK